jgi:hypothetical protein
MKERKLKNDLYYNLHVCAYLHTCTLIYAKDMSTWQTYVTNVCDKRMWQTYVTNVCDKRMWQTYVTNVCDKRMWQTYVTNVCDKRMCNLCIFVSMYITSHETLYYQTWLTIFKAYTNNYTNIYLIRSHLSMCHLLHFIKKEHMHPHVCISAVFYVSAKHETRIRRCFDKYVFDSKKV